MKNIVLTGFMGAGKSSAGKKLAQRLGMKVVDTDELIEKRAGMKISEIFEKQGEAQFREAEKSVIEEVSKLENCVVITGGGVVLKKENMDNLRRNGIIIYLHAAPEIIYQRVKSESHRPLLHVGQPMKKIKELLEFRAPYYANNDLAVDTSNMSVEQVVEEILKKMGRLQQ